jgi:hypothetical protein
MRRVLVSLSALGAVGTRRLVGLGWLGRLLWLACLASVVCLLCVGACRASGGDALFPSGSEGGAEDGGSLFGGNGGLHACVGLQCEQHACAGGGTTSVSGTVYDPAGKVPLYNVIVYVPNAPLDAIKHGASCDQCSASVSGSPVVTTLTDAAGHFKLDNVPVVSSLPLVIQIGKWRRALTVTTPLNDCGDRALDKAETRLPRNKSEGDIPQIALTTGACDPMECLLRKIGLDDAEFTRPTENGRVHVYQGLSSVDPNFGQGLPGGALLGGSPPADALWSTAATLAKYDMVLLSCECDPSPDEKPAAALRAIFDYTSAGGRVFGSHYQYYWLEDGPEPFPMSATWNHDLMMDNEIVATIDESFPKGRAFKEWLVNVGGSPAPGGTLAIGEARGDVEAVNNKVSQRWIYLPANPASVQYFTFNTPITAAEDKKCGRVVYSDLHVAGGQVDGDIAGQTFPKGCMTKDLSPQEKALEFMLFDLSSCVISDTKPPAPPPPK